MFFRKSLRVKTILSALIPTVLVLIVVTIIAFYAYEGVTRDIIRQRDTELARISAARLSEGLNHYSRVLQVIAVEEDMQSLEPAHLRLALEKAQHQLYVFDAGVVVYDNTGIALWSQPFAEGRQGSDFPIPSKFDAVRRTGHPIFSDVFQDTLSEEEVILVGVPIISSSGEFKGILVGMFKMRDPLLGPIYAEVLELKVGRSGFAYLVDGNGRVIYHPGGAQMGQNLATTVPVKRATKGETGAIFAEDPTGEPIISGFAPVPGTDWKLITQERWSEIINPIRGYASLLLGLLVMSGLLSSAVIFFSIGRLLGPIQNLTQGARRIAEGDFEHTIEAPTGDEIEVLAQQFNTMSRTLKESFDKLGQRLSEQMQIEKALRKSEARLAKAQRIAHFGNWDWDIAHNTLYWSDEIYRIFGLVPQEFGATYEAFLNSVYPYEREFVKQSVNEALYENKPYSIDHRIVLPDGSERFVHEQAEVTFDETGKAIRMVGTVQDITERKRAEEELQKYHEHLEELVKARTAELEIAKERAEEADRLKSAFLATMSHELRTPLNSIIGFTGILLKGLVGSLNDEQAKQLGMVYDSARHLLNLINDVLDISKIEAGQLKIASEPVDVPRVIEKVVQAETPLAEKKGLVLAAEVAPEVGQITSDRRRVEQILLNLVSNAIKFTEQGEVKIIANCELRIANFRKDSPLECPKSEIRNPKSEICIQVVDTGIGIKPEDMETLFKPFRQIDTGLARRQEGTGLGLSICKKLVKMLGGQIWVESKWGVGSTFMFTLPLD